MLVNIFKLGEEKIVTTFREGCHMIGRGPALQCNDKRVSRNHATIEIAAKDVKLKSTHINPCFLKVANSKTITILTKDATTQLNDGDTFAFLPDDFWFKIKIEDDKPEEKTKRHLDEPEENAPPDKKSKIDDMNSNLSHEDVTSDTNNIPEVEAPVNCGTDNEANKSESQNETNNIPEVQAPVNNGTDIDTNINETAETSTCDEEEAEANNSAVKNDENENNPVCDIPDDSPNVEVTSSQGIKQELAEPYNSNPTDDSVIKQEENENNPVCDIPDNLPNDEVTSSQGIKQEVAEPSNSNPADDDNNPSSSSSRRRRERCWYEAKCYRKNPAHRQEYTHPGDSDFESDPDDNRPSCSYGASCYRKNKDHRREYKHPLQQPPSKTKTKRARKKVQRLNVANSEDLRDFSDSEDPFIADDESDEYVGDSDDDDSDWEDSQNVDEDSENLKRMIKEANRFVKK